MDCQEVLELLDAYALGAADKTEADGLERHVADCIRCWDELNKAQRAAALVALSIPLKEAPERLGRRILSAAQREKGGGRGQPAGRGFGERLRLGWPAAAGALGLAGLAALAFAAFLQVEMNDLRDDKSDLARQVEAAGHQLDDQQQILAVMSSSDTKQAPMSAVSSESSAWGVYSWSPGSGKGFIVCHDLPPLEQGEVYQAWISTEERPLSAGTFVASNGGCQYPMDLSSVQKRPKGIGVSREPEGGSASPSEKWVLFASFENN